MEIIQDKNSRSGLIGTILVHLLLLLMFLSFGMTYQDPPEPNEGAMMINFGTSDEGSGEVEAEEASSSSTTENITPSENASAAEEQVITQDNAEAIAINASETKAEEVVQETQPVASQSLLDALNAANNTTANSENGNQGNTGNSGNQGDPEGDKNSNGNSHLPGNGIGYDLGGRGAVSLAKPDNRIQKEGTVVVDIWVNKDGKVVKAKAGARGSSTTNKTLQSNAEKAAYKTVFKKDPNAPFEQKGTLTYIFILN